MKSATMNKQAVLIYNYVLYVMDSGALCVTPKHRYKGYEKIPSVTTGVRRLDSILIMRWFECDISMENLFVESEVLGIMKQHMNPVDKIQFVVHKI